MCFNGKCSFVRSVGRQILTKRPGADDDVSDGDAEDITSLYKNPEALSRQQKQGEGCFNTLFSNRDSLLFHNLLVS